MAETTILLVEDEEAVRTLLMRVLTTRGYNVLQAENGRDALEIARRDINRISLVITDIVMPELGGESLVEELRALNPALPAVYMTGYTREEVLTGGRLDDAVFIEKPFTPGALLEQIERVLKSGEHESTRRGD